MRFPLRIQNGVGLRAIRAFWLTPKMVGGAGSSDHWVLIEPLTTFTFQPGKEGLFWLAAAFTKARTAATPGTRPTSFLRPSLTGRHPSFIAYASTAKSEDGWSAQQLAATSLLTALLPSREIRA